MTMPVEVQEPALEEVTVTDKPWIVIVWNDPVNLMNYVVYVFQKLFGYSRKKATRLMKQVHEEGKAIVSNGTVEKCEADVARLHPRALKRTFTFRELADILGRLPVEDLPRDADPQTRIVELARVAAAGRGVRAPRTWTDFDIVDPYRRDDAVYATMRDQVVSALPAVLTGLVGPRRPDRAL